MCFDRHRIEKWSDDSDWTAVHEFVVTEDDLPLDQGHTLWSEVEEKCQDSKCYALQQTLNPEVKQPSKSSLLLTISIARTSSKSKVPRGSIGRLISSW